MTLEIFNDKDRIFGGWGSVEVVDRQGDVIPISELKKIMPKVMDRGGIINLQHSNKPVGKILNYEFKTHPQTGKEGLYIVGKIYNDYDLDNEAWNGLKTGKYKGLSFGGGAKKAEVEKIDGQEANVLTGIEGYEWSIVEKPANQYAYIMEYNQVAKGIDIEKRVVKRGNKWCVIHCLNPTTYVFTKDRYGRIKRNRIGDLENPIGQEVLTEDGWKEIKEFYELDWNDKLIDITLANGHKISVTPDHPTVIRRNSKIQVVLAEEVIQSDELPYKPQEVKGIGGTYELGYAIGLFGADGSYNGERAISYVFNEQETESKEKIKSFFTSLGFVCNEFHDKNAKAIRLQVGSKSAVEFMKRYVSKDKILQNPCYNLSIEARKGIIDGWRQGDGNKNNNVIYASRISSLMSLLDLATITGYSTTLTTRNRKGYNGISQLSHSYVRKIDNKIYVKKGSTNIPIKSEDGIFWIPILNIKESKKVNKVYDFQVNSDKHWFSISNGIITHNCHGSQAGKPIKCFNTKEQADAMHRAIMMNENKGDDMEKYVEPVRTRDIIAQQLFKKPFDELTDDQKDQVHNYVTEHNIHKDDRPPKDWWNNCIRGASKVPGVTDANALCGWVYYHHMKNPPKKGMDISLDEFKKMLEGDIMEKQDEPKPEEIKPEDEKKKPEEETTEETKQDPVMDALAEVKELLTKLLEQLSTGQETPTEKTPTENTEVNQGLTKEDISKIVKEEIKKSLVPSTPKPTVEVNKIDKKENKVNILNLKRPEDFIGVI